MNYPLNEPFSIAAEWYLPHDPGRKLTGQFNYGPNLSALELQDTFHPVQGNITSDSSLKVERILGDTRAGEYLTVLRAVRTSFSLQFSERAAIQPDRFHAGILLRGVHADTDDPLFGDIQCCVPGLAMWLSRPTIAADLSQKPGGVFATFEICSPATDRFSIPALDAEVQFDAVATIDPKPFSLRVSTTGWWQLRPRSPQSLSWYLKQIAAISSFLSLCAGTSMWPDCITVPVQGQMARASVLPYAPDAQQCKFTHLHEFFLPRGVLNDDFSEVVCRWCEAYPSYEQPIGLAMSTLESDKLWQHIEFLSLMQALEGFHRIEHPGVYMDSSQYPAVYNALVSAIPDFVSRDHRQSLKSRIHYGNEVSLANRLNNLSSVLSHEIRVMLFGESASLPRKWIDTRNYYTHWDNSLLANVLPGQEMVYANARLRSFIRTVYLARAGISQAHLASALRGTNREAQFLIQILGIEQRAINPNSTIGTFGQLVRPAGPSGQSRNDIQHALASQGNQSGNNESTT